MAGQSFGRRGRVSERLLPGFQRQAGLRGCDGGGREVLAGRRPREGPWAGVLRHQPGDVKGEDARGHGPAVHESGAEPAQAAAAVTPGRCVLRILNRHHGDLRVGLEEELIAVLARSLMADRRDQPNGVAGDLELLVERPLLFGLWGGPGVKREGQVGRKLDVHSGKGDGQWGGKSLWHLVGPGEDAGLARRLIDIVGDVERPCLAGGVGDLGPDGDAHDHRLRKGVALAKAPHQDVSIFELDDLLEG